MPQQFSKGKQYPQSSQHPSSHRGTAMGCYGNHGFPPSSLHSFPPVPTHTSGTINRRAICLGSCVFLNSSFSERARNRGQIQRSTSYKAVWKQGQGSYHLPEGKPSNSNCGHYFISKSRDRENEADPQPGGIWKHHTRQVAGKNHKLTCFALVSLKAELASVCKAPLQNQQHPTQNARGP